MKDNSHDILKLINNNKLCKDLNPLIKYSLRALYDSSFRSKSIRFVAALDKCFINLNNIINIPLLKTKDSIIYNSNKNFNLKNNILSKVQEASLDNLECTINTIVNKKDNTNQFDESSFDNYYNNDSDISNLTIHKDYNNIESKLSDNIQEKVNFKYSVEAVTSFFNNEWEWFAIKMLDTNLEYILDSLSKEPLLYLIKEYLYSKEDSKFSKLLISYNIIASSIELAFCLRLVLKFPNYLMQSGEIKYYEETNNHITLRVKKLIHNWKEIYNWKLEDNVLLRKYMSLKDINNVNKLLIDKNNNYNLISQNNIETDNLDNDYNFNNSFDSNINKNASFEELKYIDLIEMTKDEPLLKKNFISFSKIIQDGIFIFDIEEISKQICLIDQELLSEISIKDLLYKIKNFEHVDIFKKIKLREKQFKAYILFFIFLITCVQVKKSVIQNFLYLAYILKKKKNYQSYITIIKSFQFINLKDKTSLWDQIDPKYKGYYLNMVNEINNYEMNDPLFNNNSNNKALKSIKLIKDNSLDINLKTQTQNKHSNTNLCLKNSFKAEHQLSTNFNHNFNNIDNNDIYSTNLSATNNYNYNTVIPNIASLNLCLELIKKKSNKDKDVSEKLNACSDFKELYFFIYDIKRNKLPYYENNPLYDFLKFGFKEIFRTDVWRSQFKKYTILRPLIEDEKKIDKILKHLDEKFKRLDSKF